MNKKYIVGGLIFWAGLSGYMGLRILESYTEDAVFAALSAVPAQAQQIRYSFLTNTLTLKGVEYELPDDTIMHKGSVENVEVRGFNRKCMFVKPDMPAYDPDTLPIVAESVVASGIVDKVHFGNSQMEQHIAEVQIRGWYQRLGMFLDQHSQHRGEVSYYEELYRSRLDGMDVNGISLTLTEPEMAPLTLNVDRIALSRSMNAPRGDEKVPTLSLTLSGLGLSGGETSGVRLSGGMQRVDLDDVRMPDPAVMVELVAFCRGLDTRPEADDGVDTFEAQLDKLLVLLEKNYENKMPLSRFAMQGVRFDLSQEAHEEGQAAQKAGDATVTFAMNSLNYALNRTAAGEVRNVMDIDGLRLNMPEMGSDDIIRRYAPEGFTLNASGETVSSDARIASKARYELEGLGSLEGDLELLGDVRALQMWPPTDEIVGDPYELLQKLQLKKLNMTYQDAGLLGMTVELIARDSGMTADALLDMLNQNLAMTSQYPNRIVQEFGSAATQQLAVPGEFVMTFAPAAPLSLMDIFSMVMAGSDDLPVSFSSKQGTKPLRDYLPKPAAQADGTAD